MCLNTFCRGFLEFQQLDAGFLTWTNTILPGVKCCGFCYYHSLWCQEIVPKTHSCFQPEMLKRSSVVGVGRSWGKFPVVINVRWETRKKPKHVQIFTGSGLEFQFVDGSRGDSCWTFMKKSLTAQSPFESVCSRPLDMEEELWPQLMSSSQNCVIISWLMRESAVMVIRSKKNPKKNRKPSCHQLIWTGSPTESGRLLKDIMSMGQKLLQKDLFLNQIKANVGQLCHRVKFLDRYFSLYGLPLQQ